MISPRRTGNSILARRLREHREQHRLTGPQLAARLKVTQGTISKLENGNLAPTIDYLSRFAHHLRLDRQQTKELINLAGVVPADTHAAEFLQFLPYDFLDLEWTHRRQGAVAVSEKAATLLRVYHPHFVPGLLQTPTYARHVFELAGVADSAQRERSVAARMERQRLLDDGQKRFTFLIAETALATRIGDREERLLQVRRLGDLARRKNVRIGLLPLSHPPPLLPPPAFTLFDSEKVLIELPHGDLWLLNAGTSDTYSKVFASLERSALFGEALLSRLSKVELRLAA